MQYKIRFFACLGFALCCVLTTGCGSADVEQVETAEQTVQEEIPESTAKGGEKNELTAQQADAYQQMVLYLQEGFRTYDIEGTYQAYFGEIETLDDDTCVCDILLEGQETGELWSERIAYSYNAENGWYTFEGIDEWIFAKDSFYEADEDSDFVKNTRANHIYAAKIAKKQDITVPIHYDSENGPVEHDMWKIPPDSEWVGRYVRSHLYTYYDDRMDIAITIEYPQVSFSYEYKELEEKINTELKNAFFFSYEYQEDSSWNPLDMAYVDITRNYVITREDEDYFSMRIFEYNDFRAANHPNEFESGITINMKTGEVLRLEDVIGRSWTPISLLETGAFQCLWGWKDGNESDEEAAENWMRNLHDSWERESAELSSLDSCFYLTQDGLGLITEIGRYYTPIEADFEELNSARSRR